MSKALEIVNVYQSLLGIYGDQGNGKVLLKRAHWRGIDAHLTTVEPGQPLPENGDIFLLGGGEDGAQTSAVRELTADGGLHRAVDRGAVIFAVCAGYQILGHSFGVGDADDVRQGLGLLDVTTTRGPQRAVGEVLHRWTAPGAPSGDDALLTGFENHGGYTHLGPDAIPLARREIGVGNDDTGTEGAVQGTIVGAYPHGPILPRNPALADHLLELALGHGLDPLPNATHDELRRRRIAWVREHGRG